MSSGMPGRIARGFVKYILPLIVIFAAVQGAKKIIASRPEPQRQEREERGVLVEVQAVELSSQRFDVSAQGTAVPSRQTVLQPQVTGRVVWQNDELMLGGLLREGDEVIRIERADYRLQVNIARAERERARVGLELEEGRGLIAEREWNLFQDDITQSDQGRSLALREPQQRDATQLVELAENRVSQARLSLDRTTVTAPFNGYVQSEMVEVGQLVGPTSQLATLVGTDEFWVQVSIPVERLRLIDIPASSDDVGSTARVWWELGSERIEREGVVVRLLPDLDPVGRMARILVAVQDPMQLEIDPRERQARLLLGTFVNVEIEGNRIEEVIELPRVALREGNRVFVKTEDRTLAVRTVEILWRRPDTVLVSSGLADGENIVLSRLSAPIEGMLLRTADDEVSSESGGPPSPAVAEGTGTGLTRHP